MGRFVTINSYGSLRSGIIMLCAVSLTLGYNKKASFVKGGGAALCAVTEDLHGRC